MNYTESEIRTGFKEDSIRKMKDLQAKAKPIVKRLKYLFDHGTEKDYPEYERKRRELKTLVTEMDNIRGTQRNTINVVGIDTPSYKTRERKEK